MWFFGFLWVILKILLWLLFFIGVPCIVIGLILANLAYKNQVDKLKLSKRYIEMTADEFKRKIEGLPADYFVMYRDEIRTQGIDLRQSYVSYSSVESTKLRLKEEIENYGFCGTINLADSFIKCEIQTSPTEKAVVIFPTLFDELCVSLYAKEIIRKINQEKKLKNKVQL